MKRRKIPNYPGLNFIREEIQSSQKFSKKMEDNWNNKKPIEETATSIVKILDIKKRKKWE